jgi:hypothetical protein
MSKIILPYSDVTTETPSGLQEGELVMNTADELLFLKNSSGGLRTLGGPVQYSGIRPNYYYTGPGLIYGSVDFTMFPNRIYMTPFLMSKTQTITRIGINVGVTVVGGARLGIYNADEGLPSSLVLDAGTVSTSTTGEKEITISQSLSPGQYFAAVLCDVAAGLKRPRNQTSAELIGSAGGIVAIDQQAALGHSGFHPYANGDLPDPFTGTGDQIANSATPIIWVRVV